ncbi:unnamed protein product [Mytilus edulis]|uniref:Exonuclease domain-containing protein n=1 Tax=Mytilus edulis TaxID=6550 RepID=A0A8S3QKQ1_MYTED|nr:unnamed protein product [Mytilus edulis]
MALEHRKQVRKLVSIREGQRKRYFEEDQDIALKSLHTDHSYDVTSKKIVPDISNIVHEEVLDNDGNNLTPTDDWRIGRRVVELGVIADHLQQCKHCGLPLSLHNIIDIKTYGLGSVLKVLCTNKSCGNINAIPTGKQHDHKIWDVNTKLALAAIDLGLGEHQINGLLSILNIPTVSHCMIDSRIREVGDVIESVADQSMEEWTEKEKEMTRESDGNDNVTVSVDAAWQRRGSGRSYDSLTGHCSMIGSKTGKVINYKWRSKACRICQRAETSEKLANLGSTQSNESFNKSVAAKAPKNRFYGGSRSLAYRVAAAVAQKNTGHRYTVDVNVSSGLSPGLYTRKLATLRDIQARKRKAVAITTEAKLRRIALKASRNQSSSTFEVREGVCYQSNTMIDTATEDSDEKILEIPAPKNKPVENDSKPDISTMTHIYFDIEATGLGRTSHITQISARRGLETFSKYILPAREITPKAAEVTGLTFQNGSLYLLDKIVPAVGVKEGLTGFISFLEKSTNNVIFGHNIYNYDCPVLYNALDNCSLLDDFQSKIVGFVDTLKLFKLSFPNLGSYSQCKLCDTLINLSYDAHNAEDDVNALFRLVNEKIDNFTDVQKVFQSELSVFYNYVSLKQMNKNVPSLKQMLDDKVVTKRTANCIARSGLNLSHLRLAYSRNGRTGIKDIFSEPCGSKARVTKSAKIIDSVSDFLKEL